MTISPGDRVITFPTAGGKRVSIPLSPVAAGDKVAIIPTAGGKRVAVKLSPISVGDKVAIFPAAGGKKIAVLTDAISYFSPWGGVFRSFITHDSLIWRIGGHDYDGSNDIWNTLTAKEWTMKMRNAAFSARYGHVVLSFNGYIWVIAGSGSSTVYKSANGTVWQLVNSSAPFSGIGCAGCVHNSRMYISLGKKVWSSVDGITWDEETTNAEFPTRERHTMTSHAGGMWIIGGFDGVSTFYNDVWYSDTGATWTEITTPTLSARAMHTAEVYDGKLWVIGGRGGAGATYNDVHYLDSGTWTQATASAAFAARYAHSSFVYDSKLWVISGVNAGGSLLYDVFDTTDGAAWALVFDGPTG